MQNRRRHTLVDAQPLKLGQAVALPLTEESGGELRLFTVAPRLTRQTSREVRGRAVSPQQAFVFARNGQPTEHRSRTLRRFVRELEHTSDGMLDGASFAATSPDGSMESSGTMRWLRNATARGRHRTGSRTDTLAEIVAAIRAR